jgi:hypothetical protein
MANATQTSMNPVHTIVANTIDAFSRDGHDVAPAFFAVRLEERDRPPGF